jgi:hypothetical protein
MCYYERCSKTVRLLLERNDPDTQQEYLGLSPTAENAKKVLDKLDSFGRMGIKGFDLAIATFAIMRNEEHETMPAFVDDMVKMFSRPFNFVESTTGDDHGLLNGYTYGLHILPKHMDDIELTAHQAVDEVSVMAENTASGRVLLSQRTTDPAQSAFENGYFGVYPSNAVAVISYLVLPKVEAVEVVERFSSASLV